MCDLQPMVPNKTRRPGVYQMIGRYNWIRGDLNTLWKYENWSLNIDSNNSFKWNAIKFERQFKVPNKFTVELQKISYIV